MRHLIILAIAWLLCSTAVYADGLIYQLPEDGSSVGYEMEITIGLFDLPVTGGGTLSVSSVGQAVVDNEKCRWLEFKMEMNLAGREQTVINKLLIPEKHLGRGKSPIDNVKRCWLKENDGDAHEVEDVKGQMGGQLYAFLSGPLKDAKKLKKEDVKSELGELPCEGSSGRLEFKQRDNEIAAEIEARLHDKAPFGVVAWKIELVSFSQGLLRENIYMTLKLAELEKNAKSELPNVN